MSAIVANGSVLAGTPSRKQLLDRASILRQELKDWEAKFAAENGGRKATRDEIKKESTIAAKYSEYQKLKQRKDTSDERNVDASAVLSSAVTAAAPRERRRDESEILQAHLKPRHRAESKPETPRKSRMHASRTVTPQRMNRIEDLRSTRHISSPGQNNKTFEIHQEEDEEIIAPPPTFIGPTPQKDGRVLGLFDLLSPVAKMQTPLKPRIILGVVTGRNSPKTTFSRTGEILFNKSPMNARGMAEPDANVYKHSRSPQSASKRYLLDAFVTPSKRQRLNDNMTTPTSNKRKEPNITGASITPAFLRRQSSMQILPAVAEDVNKEDHDAFCSGHDVKSNANTISPDRFGQATWLRRRAAVPGLIRSRSTGLGRSLSSMIAEIKQAEEDRLDEELDILREMEGETVSAPLSRRTYDQNVKLSDEEEQTSQNVRKKDAQQDESRLVYTDADLRLLGPDGTGQMTDDELVGEGLGRDGKPLRVWKKKGMKRQTRKVLLRPTTRKSHNAAESTRTKQNHDEDDEDTHNPADVVPETQFQEIPPYAEDDDDDDDDNHGIVSENDSNHESEHSSSTTGDSAYASASENKNTSPQPTKSARNTILRSNPTLTSTTTTTSSAPTNKTSPTSAIAAAAAPRTSAAAAKTEENPIKKAAKKISATAHANFRKLKIRSAKGAAGAKAGGGGGGRFFKRGRR